MKNEDGWTFKKNLFIIILVIQITIFLIGYLCGSKQKEVIKLTYDEIQLIENFQSNLAANDSEVDVIVYKDNQGELMLGWKKD